MSKVIRDVNMVFGMLIMLCVGMFVGRVVYNEPHVTPTPTLWGFLDALEWKECSGNWDAVGKLDELGSFQLRKIYVDDVNRLIDIYKPGTPHMIYEHRLDRTISRGAVELYLSHYATYDRLGYDPTFEDMARIHNGGPNGWKKSCTKQYWLDVKEIMENR